MGADAAQTSGTLSDSRASIAPSRPRNAPFRSLIASPFSQERVQQLGRPAGKNRGQRTQCAHPESVLCACLVFFIPRTPWNGSLHMDIHEHSIALISVVIGLGLTSLLGSFNRLVRQRREVHWDALPLAWALIALLLVNNYWWGVYLGMVTATSAANVGTFVANLVYPILLFLICAAALPDARATQDRDLRAAYFDESRYFFILVVCYVLATAVGTAVHVGAFRWNEHMWLRLVLISVCAPLIWTRKPWLHWLAAVVVSAIMLFVSFEMALR
jgi:hypothetical protein